MGMDDLLKGLAVFKDGMTQYHTAAAVNDANEQLTALHAQEMDRDQKIQAQSQISSSLAMRLGAAGTDASKIQALTSEIAPSQGALFQADTNKDLQENSQAFQGDEKQKDRDLQLQLERMRLKAMQSKTDKKLSKEEVAFVGVHQKAFDTQAQKSVAALSQLQIAKQALNSNNPIADKSLVNFLARASGEVGALTEADKKPFGGSTAYAAQAAQFAKNARDGKFTTENRKFVTDLINTYETAQTKNIMTVRDRISKRANTQAGLAGYNLDEAKIGEMIYPSPEAQIAKRQVQYQTEQGSIAEAEAWLQKPEAKQDPVLYQKVLQETNRRKTSAPLGPPPAKVPARTPSAANTTGSADELGAFVSSASEVLAPTAMSDQIKANRAKMKGG